MTKNLKTIYFVLFMSVLALTNVFAGVQEQNAQARAIKYLSQSTSSSSVSNVSSISSISSVEKIVEAVNPSVVKVEAEEPKKTTESKYLKTMFGKSRNKSGQQHLDQCKSTDAGRRFLQEFEEYGIDKQLIACVSLNYENGSHDLFTRGVCNAKYMEGGDYRRCNYADINSAGFDLGLFQINSFYQATRITKLGGPSCYFVNSKDWTDPCNKAKGEWLFSLDNQIKIIKDIYNEQGFDPWVAYLKNVKPYL
jgi:hypothetical protein